MKKHLKTFIFTALACTLLLGAGISAEAAEKSSKVAINDENFAWAVKEYADQADTNKDGFLSKKEASKITSVEFNSPYNIDSLKGIEYFTEIKDFTYQAYDASGDYGRHKIYENSTVEEIDLSGFKKLNTVYIQSSTPYLQTINLKNCTNLKELDITGQVEDGNVDKLNIKGCSNLQKLTLSYINIKTLKLTDMNKLADVYILAKPMETLNIKRCPAIRSLCVDSDRLTSFKQKDTDKLEDLSILSKSLKTVNLSKNHSLKKLYLYMPELTSLNVKNNKRLEKLTLFNTNVSSLDLRNNKNLIKVHCRQTPALKELRLEKCTKLKNLRIEDTGLTRLNVKKNRNLLRLRCENTPISKLNLKNNTKLRSLRCKGTKISKLDLSNTSIINVSHDDGVSVIYPE